MNGTATNGNINFTNDKDLFKVTLTAGTVYVFDLIGVSGGLADPYLRLYGSDVAQLSFDDDGGDLLNSRVTYTAATTGTYYLSAESAGTGTGAYKISARSTAVDLTPYQPTGWSDKIVVSVNSGTNTDSSFFYSDQTLYIDWATRNNGVDPINSTFFTTLYLDGTQIHKWDTTSLNAGFYAYANDYSLGFLSVGNHTIKILTDATGVITETNESNNEYSKNIVVTARQILDAIAPTVTAFSPTDEATGVAIDANIVVTFNEAVQRGTGTIVLKTSSGTVIASYDAVSSTNLSISGSTLTINPTANLSYITGYKVEFAAGSIKDIAGNSYAGVSDYNFTTGAAPDTTPPTIAISSSQSSLSIGQTATLTFAISESVSDFVVGDITVSGGTLSNFSGSGTSYTATFTPTANSTTPGVVSVGNSKFSDAAGNFNVDGSDANNTVSLTVNTVPLNNAPVAVAASVTTDEDVAKSGTLVGTDAENNALTFIKISDPAHGTVVINSASGAFTYTPAKDYNGADSFSFKVNDSKLDSGTATITLNVAAVNDAPTFATASVSVSGTEDVTLSGGVKATDVDTGDTLAYLIKTQGAKGAVTIDAATGAYTYKPTANANGADSFVVSTKDAAGAVADQTVNVTLAPVNDLPTGSLSVDGTASVGRTLTANSTLADADGLGALAYQWSANGVVITGASSSQYLLGAGDVGKTITVSASYTDQQGTFESVTSNATAKVVGANAAPTGSVVMAGVATEGQALSATNTISDADGLGAISTRWQVSSDGLGGWTDLAGATATSLSVKAAQVGLYARAVASYTDGLGMLETVNSAASHKIGALISGTAQGDVLTGTPGDDRLEGGLGADQMTGGLGDDVFVADDQLDLVYESAGQGSDTVIASASYYLWPNVENLTLTGTAYFGVGNALDNVITGSNAGNLLLGGAGNDTVVGGDARDAIFGESGNDSISGGGGIDYLIGGTGNDTIDGGTGPDEIYGEDGNDSISGGNDFATDILVGGAGNDTLDGGPAWDQMYGNAGDDTYYVSQQVDWCFEQPNEGYDTVVADSPNGFYLYANIEKLVLVGTTPFGVGNELDNVITGNAIGNVLLGGAGNDTLDGGAGQDILYGEAGADTFLIRKGTGIDIIADFTPGTDHLDVRDYGFKTTGALMTRMTQVGTDISVDLGGGDSVILMGVKMTSLGSTDLLVV